MTGAYPSASRTVHNPAPMAGILERFKLDGKVAIVTGASSGLGVAFAKGLAEAGADVAICARRVDRLRETKGLVEERGRRCVAVEADVAKPEDCRRVVEEAVDGLGRLDVLVNNAGIGTAVPATREEPDEFRKVIDINLNGSYWMAQAAARAMKDGGSIVNIGSVLGSTSAALPQAAYASSKAAIIGLTRDLAQQWTGRKGIRVNALAPGFFESEMTDQYPDGYLDQMMWRVPAGRKGEAEELTAALIFLASDASSYVTGALLPVDGGMLTT
jgi:NAD(P)-dependent dehydrogenase (short-subunit alcohol dehydrogenase family)